MNSTNKRAPGARGIPQPFNRLPGHGPQVKPVVAQLMTTVSAQSVKRPVAPPAYRPQQAPKVLQTKSSSGKSPRADQPPRRPAAPPVYRPETRKTVQPKAISLGQGAAAHRGSVHATPATLVRLAATGTTAVRANNLRGPWGGEPNNREFSGVGQGRTVASVENSRATTGRTVGVGSVIQQARGPKKRKKTAQRKAVVILTIDNKTYRGQSSGQYGHAEMNALRNFITQQASISEAWDVLNGANRKKVTCPNQPVCGSCTKVLEALEFSPKGPTVFSKKKSGGVSWGANMKVRELMEYGGEATREAYRSALRAGAK